MFVTLIPMVDNKKLLQDYILIKLCNFSYKLTAKIIVSRLRKLLPMLIPKELEAFVYGRSIYENILLVQKIL